MKSLKRVTVRLQLCCDPPRAWRKKIRGWAGSKKTHVSVMVLKLNNKGEITGRAIHPVTGGYWFRAVSTILSDVGFFRHLSEATKFFRVRAETNLAKHTRHLASSGTLAWTDVYRSGLCCYKRDPCASRNPSICPVMPSCSAVVTFRLKAYAKSRPSARLLAPAPVPSISP